jgi:AraC-like DNA-binding protein
MASTVLASIGKILWKASQSLSLDSTQLFLDAGLDPSIIGDARSRYSGDLLVKAWALAIERSGETNIGLYAVNHYSPNDLHALGTAFLTSRDLMDALNRFSRYAKVLGNDYRFNVEVSANEIICIDEYIGTNEFRPPLIEDMQHALVTDLCRKGAGETLNPISVSFCYPRPADISEHQAFFRCELKFNQPHSGLCFSRQDSERHFIDENRDIARGNDQILDSYIARLQDLSTSSKVKQVILDRLASGAPTEGDVANALHMGSRTLSRRLADENTSFRELLTTVRRELADAYITDETIPITEISYILGFSDLSSFSRAFKVWNGHSPKVSRDRLSS